MILEEVYHSRLILRGLDWACRQCSDREYLRPMVPALQQNCTNLHENATSCTTAAPPLHHRCKWSQGDRDTNDRASHLEDWIRDRSQSDQVLIEHRWTQG